MPTFGTLQRYQEMARCLNDDEAWIELGKAISCTMLHVYTAPVDKAFFLRFVQGKITDICELTSPEADQADFILSATPETWQKVSQDNLKSKSSYFDYALSTGAIEVTGPFRMAYLERRRAWKYVFRMLARPKDGAGLEN